MKVCKKTIITSHHALTIKHFILSDLTLSCVNGMEYARTTDNNFYALIGINLDSGICRHIQILIIGLNYNAIEIKSTILTNDVTKYFRNDTQFYAILLNKQGSPLANTVSKININGVFYQRTSNAQGIIKLNLNIEPGTYILVVSNLITGEIASSTVHILPRLVENHGLVKYYRNASR